MSEWGLVEARRGSGVVVRDMRHWSIEALPAFLIHGKIGHKGLAMGRVIKDMLGLRRSLLVEAASFATGRVTQEGLDESRRSLARAWAERDNYPLYARLDFRIYSALFESAGMFPAVWMLNSVGRVYIELAPTLGAAITPPDNYLEDIGAFLDAMEAGDSEAARNKLLDYFESVDRRLGPLLEVLGT